MYQEHSQVVLKSALPSLGLEPGDVGIVVHSYANGDAYEIEFLSLDGNTIGTSTVSAIDLKPISSQAIMHERLRLTA